MDKQSILKKLKAFASRTVENGCTEAEAIAAAKAMQSLQNQYDCTLTELDISLTEYVKEKVGLGNKIKHPVSKALFGVQVFTGVKFVFSGPKVTVFGQQHKVDNAVYLIGLLQASMELEYLSYKNSADFLEESFYHHARSIRTSFMNGMAGRLSVRLCQMHKESRQSVAQPTSSNGTSLVVMADNALETAYRKEWPRLRSGSSRSYSRSRGASSAGANAANRVGLRTGVSRSGSQRLLG